MKKVYFIGIGGIGISGIARYYLQNGYEVYGSDSHNSVLIETLQNEGINIIIGEDESRIDNTFEKIIYTEAVPKTQSELKKASDLNLKVLTYPESLAEIANSKKLVAISGTHGKSTTTSLTSLVLKDSKFGLNALIGSILKEFSGKNVYFSNSENFVLEACEYKRSFLKYHPFIGVITNIDLDHLDYYKDLEDYISAFEEFINNITVGGYAIIDGNCSNSMSLFGIRNDIHYVVVKDNSFEIFIGNKSILKENIKHFNMQVPGPHIYFDGELAYTVGRIFDLNENEIISSLEKYNGIWRRSEIVGTTLNGNILLSDYGHHPTEISLNLKALKGKYNDKKILTIFQPHQYSRTLELLEDFKNCFGDTDILVIPNIYESRDSKEDMEKIDGKKLVEYINHPNKIFGDGFSNTLKITQDFDKKYPNELIIILQGAGDIDELRYKIDFK